MKRLSWFFAILIACLAAPLLAQAQAEPPTPAASESDIAERYQPERIQWRRVLRTRMWNAACSRHAGKPAP
jgi:hypothetical protein